MRHPEAFIGGPTGGIPNSVFRVRPPHIIEGLSGRSKLECKFLPMSLSIEDVTNRDLRFGANVIVKKGENLLAWGVNNKMLDGLAKHPDIYPWKLLERSVAFFEEQGYPIDGIIGHWYDDPYGILLDNYNAYWENLLAHPGCSTKEDEKAAALATPSGKMAQRIGFGVAGEVAYGKTPDGHHMVTTIFRRQ